MLQALRLRFDALVAAQAAALGCTATVDWMQDALPYYPPTVNDAEAYRFAADVATRWGGKQKVGADAWKVAGSANRAAAVAKRCSCIAVALMSWESSNSAGCKVCSVACPSV